MGVGARGYMSKGYPNKQAPTHRVQTFHVLLPACPPLAPAPCPRPRPLPPAPRRTWSAPRVTTTGHRQSRVSVICAVHHQEEEAAEKEEVAEERASQTLAITTHTSQCAQQAKPTYRGAACTVQTRPVRALTRCTFSS